MRKLISGKFPARARSRPTTVLPALRTVRPRGVRDLRTASGMPKAPTSTLGSWRDGGGDLTKGLGLDMMLARESYRLIVY
jgi:hypothetical protein